MLYLKSLIIRLIIKKRCNKNDTSGISIEFRNSKLKNRYTRGANIDKPSK